MLGPFRVKRTYLSLPVEGLIFFAMYITAHRWLEGFLAWEYFPSIMNIWNLGIVLSTEFSVISKTALSKSRSCRSMPITPTTMMTEFIFPG